MAKAVCEYTIPVKIVSEANCRDHWRKKAKRVQQQRDAAMLLTRDGWNSSAIPLPPWRITMIRIIGKRQRPYDGDNLQRALKAVRDGIAKALEVDDMDKSIGGAIEWRYEQERLAGDGVLVRIESIEMETT